MNTKIIELDGVRGLAILLVVNTHAAFLYSSTGGMVGVTLFFVLSGFLITRLLLIERAAKGTLNLPWFYARRAFRLLPALAVYLVGIAVLADLWRLDQLPTIEMTWPPALYLANYVQILGQDIYLHRHTWSLAVEEHFYLAWPVLVALGATRRVRWLALSVLLLLSWRFVLGFGLDLDFWAYHGTDTNAYALGLGCLIAVVHAQDRLWRLPAKTAELAFAMVLALSLLPLRGPGHMVAATIWVPPVAAVLGALIIVGAVQDGSPVFRNTWLRRAGLISYSLYLWHGAVLMLPGLYESFPRRAFAVLISVMAATLSWVLIEGPLLRGRWRARFSESLSPARSN